MKRLLDETTDDFTRALLVAGIEQRPPAGNKRKVLIALGAGSALGLFSSHALAWLGTSGGKLSLLGVALGMAGAVYAVDPWSETEPKRGSGASAAGVSRVAVPGAAVSAAAVSAGQSASPLEPSQRGVAHERRDAVEPDEGVRSIHPEASPAVASKSGPSRARPAKTRSKRDRGASASSEPHSDGSQPAVPAPPEGAAPLETEPGLDSASLEAEVRLVDDMRWAARHNDREALARLVATYRASFPDGQLEEEVSAFAARLERPTTP